MAVATLLRVKVRCDIVCHSCLIYSELCPGTAVIIILLRSSSVKLHSVKHLVHGDIYAKYSHLRKPFLSIKPSCTFHTSIRQHAVCHFTVRHGIRIKCIMANNFHRRDTLCKLSPLKSGSVKCIRPVKNKFIRCDCSIKFKSVPHLIYDLHAVASLHLADSLPYGARDREPAALVIVGCRAEKLERRNLLYSLKSLDAKRDKSALLTREYRMGMCSLYTDAGCAHDYITKIFNSNFRYAILPRYSFLFMYCGSSVHIRFTIIKSNIFTVYIFIIYICIYFRAIFSCTIFNCSRLTLSPCRYMSDIRPRSVAHKHGTALGNILAVGIHRRKCNRNELLIARLHIPCKGSCPHSLAIL